MTPTTKQPISTERIAQLEHATLLIYEHIKLADQKALVFITLNGGLVGGLYGIKILESPHVGFWLSVVAFVLLITGMAISLWVVAPRRASRPKSTGIIDPWRISEFKNPQAYLEHVRGIDDSEFESEFTGRIFDLSQIDQRKYWWLTWAIRLSSAAWALSLALALWHSSHPSSPSPSG